MKKKVISIKDIFARLDALPEEERKRILHGEGGKDLVKALAQVERTGQPFVIPPVVPFPGDGAK
jgi:hypothetical protein